jgi:elongation factor P--beta-lysine ligase
MVLLHLPGVKSKLIQEVKTQQASLLSQSDWAVVRYIDTTVAVPSNIQAWRNAIRSKATEMETAITNAEDIDAIAALFLTYTIEDDGSITKSGILYDWPELVE